MLAKRALALGRMRSPPSAAGWRSTGGRRIAARDFAEPNNPGLADAVDAFEERLRADGGARVRRVRAVLVHVPAARVLAVTDGLKGLTLDQALAQLRWGGAPVGSVAGMVAGKLGEAVLVLGDAGWALRDTYVAHVVLSSSGAWLGAAHAETYVKGRGRYGATPHPLITNMEVVYQQRAAPFASRVADASEWIRERLRRQVKGPSAEELYVAMRDKRPVKSVYC
ncbi:hypothetical protein SeLEV6574_g02691 [Synchytrium endobioticum]|nr:hypothetical protein SeLEV6574_g02691 [Synchytrium endobioticum]